MRRNIFTGYIIGNRLNFKTFFEPIINFIEIGNRKEPPQRTVYANFISYGSNKNTKILIVTKTDICNRKFETALFNLFNRMILIFSYDKKRKIRKLFFFVIVIMPKYQVGTLIFMVIF